MDVGQAVQDVKAGKIDFRVDKNGGLHTSIGKAGFSAQQIEENASAFLREIVRLRPSAAKGIYMKSITLSTTMGPGVPIDRSAVTGAARA